MEPQPQRTTRESQAQDFGINEVKSLNDSTVFALFRFVYFSCLCSEMLLFPGDYTTVSLLYDTESTL